MDELIERICDNLNREDAMIGGNGVGCNLVRAVMVEAAKTHVLVERLVARTMLGDTAYLSWEVGGGAKADVLSELAEEIRTGTRAAINQSDWPASQ